MTAGPNPRITPYVGSGPYCYTNTLVAILGAEAPADWLVESLTGSPFGFQLIAGRIPLFDPYGWDPDTGIDQALRLLGIECDRLTFDSAEDACEVLAEQLRHGPVMLGPVEMGLLRHQPGATGPIGADHFVLALDIDEDAVTFHDPHGFPWTRLPIDVFCAAWKGETVAYADGAFPMRTGFRRARRGDAHDAVMAFLPEAAAWLAGRDIAMPPGSLGGSQGLDRLADMVTEGLPEEVDAVLTNFALRLGTRRRVDAARTLTMVDEPVAADLLHQQAKVLGSAQYYAVVGDDEALAACFRQVARLHEDLTEQMSRHLR